MVAIFVEVEESGKAGRHYDCCCLLLLLLLCKVCFYVCR